MSFKPNPAFIPELERSEGVRHTLRGAAENVRRIAVARAHLIMPEKGRRQRTQIVVEETADGEVRLTNLMHGGHIDEFGSSTSPAYAPLRRSVRAAGYRLREDR